MGGQADNDRSDWRGLDLRKCLGVVGMILHHSVYFTWTYSGRVAIGEDHHLFELFRSMMFLGFFPLMLPILAGATFYIRVAPKLANNAPILSLSLVMQCVAVALVGYAMDVLAAGWYALHAWNVLQTVAMSMLLIALLVNDRFAVGSVAIAGFLRLAVSDPLRQWWQAESRSDIVRVVLGDPTDWHSWPLVPWFSLVAFGFAGAHVYRRLGDKRKFASVAALLGLGPVLVAAWSGRLLPAFDQDNMIGPAVMQPPTVAVLGLIGVTMSLCAFLTAVRDHVRIARYGLVRCYITGILWIYLVHLVVGLRLSTMIYLGDWQRETVLDDPLKPHHLAVLIGLPILLLAISGLGGLLTLLRFHKKRFQLRLRRVMSV